MSCAHLGKLTQVIVARNEQGNVHGLQKIHTASMDLLH